MNGIYADQIFWSPIITHTEDNKEGRKRKGERRRTITVIRKRKKNKQI
jgi:hypothetical protein